MQRNEAYVGINSKAIFTIEEIKTRWREGEQQQQQ